VKGLLRPSSRMVAHGFAGSIPQRDIACPWAQIDPGIVLGFRWSVIGSGGTLKCPSFVVVTCRYSWDPSRGKEGSLIVPKTRKSDELAARTIAVQYCKSAVLDYALKTFRYQA
jgi:hypothetical protein